MELTPEFLRKIGIDGVVHDVLPAINEMHQSSKREIERLTRELEVQKIRNEEQLKLMEAMMKGLKPE